MKQTKNTFTPAEIRRAIETASAVLSVRHGMGQTEVVAAFLRRRALALRIQELEKAGSTTFVHGIGFQFDILPDHSEEAKLANAKNSLTHQLQVNSTFAELAAARALSIALDGDEAMNEIEAEIGPIYDALEPALQREQSARQKLANDQQAAREELAALEQAALSGPEIAAARARLESLTV